jgi:hypothetical protein
MSTLEQCVRERTPLYLSPEVAACAGITLRELQAFVSGAYAPLGGGGVTLSGQQLTALALRMRIAT